MIRLHGRLHEVIALVVAPRLRYRIPRPLYVHVRRARVVLRYHGQYLSNGYYRLPHDDYDGLQTLNPYGSLLRVYRYTTSVLRERL